MQRLLALLFAISGVYMLSTSRLVKRGAIRSRRSRVSPQSRVSRKRGAPRVSTAPHLSTKPQHWLTQAGLQDVRLLEFIGVQTVAFGFTAGCGFLIFGTPLAALTAGLCAASAPFAMYRSRRTRLQEQAREAWPRMLEDLRLQSGAIGRSLPIALFDAGTRAPTQPMRDAFARAEREWNLTTDFRRAASVLTVELADATADVVCQTLIVAHDLGGSDTNRRLQALIDDRRSDVRNRQEAISRQAGVRFARWFVLFVPIGMALVGLVIGDGRASYRTLEGQVFVAAGIMLTAACWVWASAIMRLPSEPRILLQPKLPDETT